MCIAFFRKNEAVFRRHERWPAQYSPQRGTELAAAKELLRDKNVTRAMVEIILPGTNSGILPGFHCASIPNFKLVYEAHHDAETGRQAYAENQG